MTYYVILKALNWFSGKNLIQYYYYYYSIFHYVVRIHCSTSCNLTLFVCSSSYYGPNGIGFTVGRVPIGGCDFSPRPYTYNDHPGDVNLTKFSLQVEDHKYKVRIFALICSDKIEAYQVIFHSGK